MVPAGKAILSGAGSDIRILNAPRVAKAHAIIESSEGAYSSPTQILLAEKHTKNTQKPMHHEITILKYIKLIAFFGGGFLFRWNTTAKEKKTRTKLQFHVGEYWFGGFW